jgi:hypothetical protein
LYVLKLPCLEIDNGVVPVLCREGEELQKIKRRVKMRCGCGEGYMPVRIGVTDNEETLLGTVCWKLWCPKCENPYMDHKGNVVYYRLTGNGGATIEPLDFWVPENVQFQHKLKFINAVLKMANENRFKGTQFYSMQEIRKAYQQNQQSKDYSTYGEKDK